MREEQRIRMLQCPSSLVDVVIDTDTFNEVDDQFALAYLLKNQDRLRLQAICAAPFLNEKADTPKTGMEKSYQEIMKLLELAEVPEYKEKVYRGAEHFLEDERTPVCSEAAEELVKRALAHSEDNPLYVIGIAAATNIASAILLEPKIRERMVVIWLGGSAFHCEEMEEFNLSEDVLAARILFDSGVPLVHLPCWGVVENFAISRPELETYFLGKNPLADYLADYTIQEVEKWAAGTAWAKVIWDVTAVAWLLNDGQRFMKERIVPCPEIAGASGYLLPDEARSCRKDIDYGMPDETRSCRKDMDYGMPDEARSCRRDRDYGNPRGQNISGQRHSMKYVYRIERDTLLTDLIKKLCSDDIPGDR